ncbi:putative Galactoside 2-alpha-L-fucosyltransferase 2 [Hypsibius exemplaris]|uniref:L-Fucosyltransferase n=1 Tax=Hypsibius exemplaris TaxID=2072580 RepID=A0A1W0WFP2_HYPEX|nr:putative Galactoside 2-alpha-L-fucosyltransferase 2 [Hypsibius exemplaris]
MALAVAVTPFLWFQKDTNANHFSGHIPVDPRLYHDHQRTDHKQRPEKEIQPSSDVTPSGNSWAFSTIQAYPDLGLDHLGDEAIEFNSNNIQAMIRLKLEFIIQARLTRARKQRRKMEDDFVFHGHSFEGKPRPLFVTLSVPGGGLGNYMFMVATLVGVARKNNRIPILMYPDHRANYFEGLALEVTAETNLYPNRNLTDDDLMFEAACSWYLNDTANLSTTKFANRTVALRGYLQSFMYFDEFREEIRTMFTFKEHTLNAAKDAILQGIQGLDNTSTALHNQTKVPTLVGIHVRRGDILHDPHKAHGQTPATEQYLLRTALRYQRKYAPVLFIVISNDIAYCREVFVDDHFVFISGTPLEVDMAIMTLMDQMIMSVGSYSFWGAYLNGQATDISYFRDWPRPGSDLARITNKSEYFLPSWHGRI